MTLFDLLLGAGVLLAGHAIALYFSRDERRRRASRVRPR